MKDLARALQDPLIKEVVGDQAQPPERLCGGLTNRNYLLRGSLGTFVLRLNHQQPEALDLHRDYERAIHQAAADAGISPRVRVISADGHYWLRDYIPGESLDISALDADDLSMMADTLKTCHQLIIAGVPPMNVAAKAQHYLKHCPEAEQAALTQQIKEVTGVSLSAPTLCHMDPLPANWIRDTAGKLWLIDWEYAASGHPLLDYAAVALHIPHPLTAHWRRCLPPHSETDWQAALQQLQLLETLWYKAGFAQPER